MTALTLAWALTALISTGFVAHAREMYKARNYREMCGTLAVGAVPLAVVSLFWAATPDAGDAMARTVILAAIGAVLGGALLAYAGHVVNARAQSPTTQTPTDPNKQEGGVMPSDNRKGNFSEGQKGGKLEQHYHEKPAPPVLRALDRKTERQPNGTYQTKVHIEIVAEQTPASLTFKVEAAELLGVNVMPDNPTAQVLFPPNGYAISQTESTYQESFARPSGRYFILVTTKAETPVKFAGVLTP